MTDATKTDAKKPDAKPDTKPTSMFVLDTTATPDSYDSTGKVVTGARVHEQMVGDQKRPYRFEYAKPTELPQSIALKFLKDPAFVLTDEKGQPLEYKRPPKQPDELQAGEQIKLADDETVARLDEITTMALKQRVAPLPGGEAFTEQKAPDRDALIAFIVARRVSIKKANVSKDSDGDADSFTPPAEMDDAA